MSWLRTYKKRQYEASLETTGAQFSDEPPWIIAQMLQRKREDLLRKWEEREERLAKLRVKEKELEQHGGKRRRVKDPRGKGEGEAVDEVAAFLLDDWEETGETSGDGRMTLFSKETKALMDKVGMGPLKKEDDEGGELEDEIKVSGRLF
jgi:chromosome transmission fidelity protein 1